MRRSHKALTLPALLGLLSLAPAAYAAQATPDEVAPIATSNGGAAPVEAVDPHAKPDQIAWPPLPADEEAALDAPAPRKIHGMVEAGVGTGGYRHVGGVMSVPIGETGQVTVAISKTDGDLGRYRYR